MSLQKRFDSAVGMRLLRPTLVIAVAAGCCMLAACDKRPADPAKPTTGTSAMSPVPGAAPGTLPGTAPGTASGTMR